MVDISAFGNPPPTFLKRGRRVPPCSFTLYYYKVLRTSFISSSSPNIERRGSVAFRLFLGLCVSPVPMDSNLEKNSVKRTRHGKPKERYRQMTAEKIRFRHNTREAQNGSKKKEPSVLLFLFSIAVASTGDMKTIKCIPCILSVE